MIRPKEQPGLRKFATLPELDHDIGKNKLVLTTIFKHVINTLGQETFVIETPFNGSFKVNAYMDCDSPEDIAQKVYSLTDIPVPYISLFIRYLDKKTSFICYVCLYIDEGTPMKECVPLLSWKTKML